MIHPATDRSGLIHLPSARSREYDFECGCKGDISCDPPRPLERNRFYPRKRMEVRHWQAEQLYHRDARELLSRLGVGTGVLCGLEFEATESGTCIIRHGIGIDGRGRLVIVPHDVEVDPTRLTDCRGIPTEDIASEGTVTVAICYRECGTDRVPVPSTGCDDDPVCIPSMVRETFAVAVTLGAAPRVGLPDGLCVALAAGHVPEDAASKNPIPPQHQIDRRQLLDLLDPRSCDCAELCIPIATVEFRGEDRSVQTAVRTVIRSNRELLDLIMCLTDRVNDCCPRMPATYPPRIVALWPWPDENGEGLGRLMENRKLEIGFDRDMAEQGLDDPNDWLGVWMLDANGARRLHVERSGSALTHITPPAGGDGAVFTTSFDAGHVDKSTVFVVMVRSKDGGPIRAAGADQLALDGELAATGLSQDQRDWLWALSTNGDYHTSKGGFTSDAQAGAPPWLPTGNGLAGGELHVVYRQQAPVELPPRLLEVWPRGGQLLGPESAGRVEDWKSFLERPRTEIVVSRALSEDAIASPAEWLRVWHAEADDGLLFNLQEIGLEKAEEQPLANGAVRYVFPYSEGVKWFGKDEILTQLRSTPPVLAASPLGRDDPKVLLDADFAGTTLDSQTLFGVWAGASFPNGLPILQALPTEGEFLYDGIAGGLAHWGFTALRP